MSGNDSRAASTDGAGAALIDGPGTGEADWLRSGLLAGLPALAPDELAGHPGWADVAVVAAHPDDEVLGAGGLIALLAAAGRRIRIVAVTDGAASHPGADPAHTARRRVAERTAALAALGASGAEVIRLQLPDAGLAQCAGDVAAGLAAATAGASVVLAPWAHDAHADHETAGAAAARLGCPAYHYPVWMWHWAGPGDARVPWSRALRVPLPASVAAAKAAAIGCFASQTEPRAAGAGPVLTASFLAHFTRGFELLLPADLP